jgi:hypothetical protein
MKKRILPRLAGLSALYTGVLLLLGTIQFSGRGIFTRHAGALLITGHYLSQEYPNHYALAGSLNIAFGGIEFRMNPEEFALIRHNGSKEYASPESLFVSGETAAVAFPGGTKLIFASQGGEQAELAINAVFGEQITRLELPYRPLKTAKLEEQANGQFRIAVNEKKYQFNRFLTHAERRSVMLYPETPHIGYHGVYAIQEEAFSVKDFIVPQAHNPQTYEKALLRWREQNFALWSKNIPGSNNEDMVVAYSGEAVSQGTYAGAVSSIPADFLNGDRRTYESSVFLGALPQALRSLTSAEQEKRDRLAQRIAEGSLDFLNEPGVFEYLAIRGDVALIDAAAEIIRALPPEELPAAGAAGILEGYDDWNRHQEVMDKTQTVENPFEPYMSQVYLIIAGGVKKIPPGDRVFVFFENPTDVEFNLRLGKALARYAEYAGNTDWAAVGRSLILSALSLVNESGTVPSSISRAENGIVQEAPDSPRFGSAKLYRILNPGESYPRAVRVLGPPDPVWAWTGATDISITREGGDMDIAAAFPVGLTHYMLVRGIPPPSKVQLYEKDYRTAPDFERYDSSGWLYSAAEQTLLIKMRHRSPVEHVRIFLSP